jgi:tetratricopeptide (TPR) repeat protein
MRTGTGLRRRLILLFGLLLIFGFSQVRGQEQEGESKEAAQYREDYERLQKIIAISDVTKKADALFQFMKERTDSKVLDYAQGNYLQVIDSFAKAEKYPVVAQQCERLIKLRPRVGETYYYYGAALKNMNRIPEAMTALAKCTLIKNAAARKANEFLEFIYKAQNQGSIIGLEKIKKAAQADLNK